MDTLSHARLLAIGCFHILLSSAATAQTTYTLKQLEALALESSPAALAIRQQKQIASAGVSIAKSYPNPELEYMKGNASARLPGATPGHVESITLTQPIDLPNRRSARIASAEAQQDAAAATVRAQEAELIARLRLRYFELLKRQHELKAALEDQETIESIRSRIALRVEVGEAPRYELIKSETEMLNAQKNALTAELKAKQARAALRAIAGSSLPADFDISGDLSVNIEIPNREDQLAKLKANNPDLQRVAAEMRRAEHQLDLERAQRLPSLALKASRDNDPDLKTSRIGIAITIPLWDRRGGNVAEAKAQLQRTQYEGQNQTNALERSFDAAYEQYLIAQTQVSALESGIIRQAESALRVAQAAYRYGERGILEVLDAQRVYRLARIDLINAKFELATAWIEIERLVNTPGNSSLQSE